MTRGPHFRLPQQSEPPAPACGSCPHLDGVVAGLRLRLALADDDFRREHEAHSETRSALYRLEAEVEALAERVARAERLTPFPEEGP